MFKVGDYVIPKDSKTIKVINEIEEIENQFIIYIFLAAILPCY